jgi:predicted O-linked N-acetylglucosamine transferase (SPINDLY family)
VEHVRRTRARLTESLARLEAEGLRVDPTQEQVPTHFYLAYQGENDRDLHVSFGRFGQGPRRLDVRPARRPPSGKLRVGFLSAYLRNHTIGSLNHRLVRHLSRQRFEVFVLSVGAPDAGLGRQIQQAADHYLVLPPGVGPALKTAADLGLDILFHTDVGMNALTYTMGFSRLAAVQCCTWGHPVTTGLPTMDYFLSARHLDDEGAEGHYTEKLVRLPRLGVVYDRPERPASADRASFGLPADAHLYACPQTLFKFHPEFDALLADLLRRDPAGLLLLIEGRSNAWKEMLLARFRRTLPDVLDRVRFLPRLSRPDYLRLLAAADVMLDPIHFGGGNTSYESFAMGTPIVTWPSAFLRGRLTYAMYCQMGWHDLVVGNAADYVERAVRLGTDPDYRAAMRRRIDETAGVLYGDVAVVRDLEAALEQMWAVAER